MRPARERQTRSLCLNNRAGGAAVVAHTAGNTAPAASYENPPGAGVYKEERGAEKAVGARLGKPRSPSLPPSPLGKPGLGPPLSLCERQANPLTVFPQSARQTQTGSSLSCGGRLANPSTVFPQFARQTQTGSLLPYFGPARQTRGPAAAAVVPDRRAAEHRGTYHLVPLELPACTPPRAAKPWSRPEAPIDPRGHTPLPTPDPAVRGTCWDPCPDVSIEEILRVRMRLAPLLSPLKSPAPQLRPAHL